MAAAKGWTHTMIRKSSEHSEIYEKQFLTIALWTQYVLDKYQSIKDEFQNFVMFVLKVIP